MHASNRLPDLNEKQELYLEWLVDPERKGNKRTWARENDVDYSTLHRWQRTDRFRRALRKRLDDLNVRPDRVQEVLENLHRQATGQGREAVAAAKAYLQYVERLEPQRKPIEDRKISELSQQELLQQLEAAVDDQRRKNVKAVNE